MKTKTNIAYIALVFFGLAQLTHAQCPQICDGSDNSALGSLALENNFGLGNTAVGFSALSFKETDGSYNIALGYGAMSNPFVQMTGSYNIAIGTGAHR
jgi:hypothetical protein